MSTGDCELDVGLDAFPRDSWKNDAADALMDAIDLASDQDTVTWLTENGKRVAAIVPAGMAEHLDGLALLREDPVVQQIFRRL